MTLAITVKPSGGTAFRVAQQAQQKVIMAIKMWDRDSH